MRGILRRREPDVMAHMATLPPGWTAENTLALLAVLVVVVWVLEALASTFNYGPKPDASLTIAASGIVGAFCAYAVRQKGDDDS